MPISNFNTALKKSAKYKILPVDIVVAVYLTLTAILFLLLPQPASSYISHIYFRFLLIAGIAAIIVLDSKFKNNFTSFVHLFYPLALLSYVYGETALLNHLFFNKDFDPFFINLDKLIFGFQPAIAFSRAFPQVWFSELMNLGYFSYYFMTIGVALTIYFIKREFAKKAVFIIITSFFIYYLTFIIFPVVGPQFYFKPPLSEVPVSGFFSKAVKLVQEYGEHPTGAFPSSHVGMALIFLWLSFKSSKTLFIILLPFVVIILFATVYIKAHYATDVIGGILSAPAVMYLSLKIHSFFVI